MVRRSRVPRGVSIPLSASRVECWQQCPFKYWLQYFSPERDQIMVTGDMSLGTQIHRMIPTLQKKKYLSPETFANTFKSRWNRVVSQGSINGRNIHWRDEKERWILRAIGMKICRYLWQCYHNDPDVVAQEWPFKIMIEGQLFRGSLDEIRLGSEIEYQGFRFRQPVIRDHKSGPGPFKPMRIANDLQFILYTVALGCLLSKNPPFRDIFGIPEAITQRFAGNPIYASNLISFEYHSLRSEKIIPVTYSDINWYDFCRIVDDMLANIKNGNFIRNRKSCGFCEAGELCQKYFEGEARPEKQEQLTLIPLMTIPITAQKHPRQLKLYKRGEIPRKQKT